MHSLRMFLVILFREFLARGPGFKMIEIQSEGEL